MTTSVSHLTNAAAAHVIDRARQMLSGKRAALIGFNSAFAEDLASVMTEAQAFTRPFSSEINPSADVLKPFELVLINVEVASASPWLNGDELAPVVDRSLALGSSAAFLSLLISSQLPFREFCVWPASSDELLCRCISALRSGGRAASRFAAANSTVVLADDDPSTTALVRLTLQRNGMICELASTGGEALQLVEKWKPSAAVLDVGMPNMDGFEVLSRIRNNPDLAQTRVILLTGCEQEKDILRGFSLGADDYVIKPFNPMELLMRLKRVIGRI